ncbi:hypothetical protein [Ralstonia pseudosolanacearum]
MISWIAAALAVAQVRAPKNGDGDGDGATDPAGGARSDMCPAGGCDT